MGVIFLNIVVSESRKKIFEQIVFQIFQGLGFFFSLLLLLLLLDTLTLSIGAILKMDVKAPPPSSKIPPPKIFFRLVIG